MKKLFALLLCFALVLSVAACGKKAEPTEPTETHTDADNQVYTEPDPEDKEASVIFLNHDAGTDEAWRSLADAYAVEFGVKVTVLTAAEAYYGETLTEQLEKDDCPTLFYAKDADSLKSMEDLCLDLSGTELAGFAELTVGGKAVGAVIPTGGYWCVNAKASQLDIDATIAFLNWALTSQSEVLFPQN